MNNDLRIIGERINTANKTLAQAVRERDAAVIRGEALRQVACGAHMIDVNCSSLGDEERDALPWLVEVVQEAVEVPLCIDTPNAAALERALAVCDGKGGRRAVVNSITAEGDRFESFLPLITGAGAGAVALAVDDRGLPRDTAETVAVGIELVERLLAAGLPPEDIYFDPVLRSLATSPGAAGIALPAVRAMKKKFPGIRALCGLSNISHGLPERQGLNAAFLVLAMAEGLDTVIMDPTQEYCRRIALAARAVLGHDQRGIDYIRAYRKGLLDMGKPGGADGVAKNDGADLVRVGKSGGVGEAG